MHTTHLRKVGGSIMLSVPPALLEMLHLQVGATVGVVVEGNRLVIEPQPRAHYTLDELLSLCDASQPLSVEDQEWSNSRTAGRELL